MSLEIRLADYNDDHDAKVLVSLLDQYARDPFGGGSGLGDFTKNHLADKLADLPNAYTLLAFHAGEAVGIANCFLVFSTFKCQPVLNIHDFAVIATARNVGVGHNLLRAVEELAHDHGCCKITLEVLSGNEPAKRLYERFGFTGYALQPNHGEAVFWEKPL